MGMMRSILLLLIVAVAVAEVTSSGYRTLNIGATICQGYPVDVDADVRILKTAIDSSNVTAITDVITKRTNSRRMEIAEKYNRTYGSNLIENLESKLTGNVKNLIVALMTPLFDYLAKELHDAMSRSPIDELAIIEILCTSPESDISNTYNKKYGSLESDLKGMNGSQPLLRRLFAARVTNQLNHKTLSVLSLDARQLHSASTNHRLHTDESPLYSILLNRTQSDLLTTFYLYKEFADHNIEDAIETDFPNDNKNKKGLLALVKCINTVNIKYLADRLNASMAKDETDERTLTRIIITRSEIDLESVKYEFTDRNSNLDNLIAERITSDDDYKYALLSIITPSRMYCSTDADK